MLSISVKCINCRILADRVIQRGAPLLEERRFTLFKMHIHMFNVMIYLGYSCYVSRNYKQQYEHTDITTSLLADNYAAAVHRQPWEWKFSLVLVVQLDTVSIDMIGELTNRYSKRQIGWAVSSQGRIEWKWSIRIRK